MGSLKNFQLIFKHFVITNDVPKGNQMRILERWVIILIFWLYKRILTMERGIWGDFSCQFFCEIHQLSWLAVKDDRNMMREKQITTESERYWKVTSLIHDPDIITKSPDGNSWHRKYPLLHNTNQCNSEREFDRNVRGTFSLTFKCHFLLIPADALTQTFSCRF